MNSLFLSLSLIYIYIYNIYVCMYVCAISNFIGNLNLRFEFQILSLMKMDSFFDHLLFSFMKSFNLPIN